ncbi:hypothetical protein D3C87_1596890 [compost metagenome]
MVSASQIMSNTLGSSLGMWCISIIEPRQRFMWSSPRRMALSMPSASTSTLSMPMASRSSFSHWMTERSFIDAFSTGTSRVSLVCVSTKPPTCWLRWRGKPLSFCVCSIHCISLSRSSFTPTRAAALSSCSPSTVSSNQ